MDQQSRAPTSLALWNSTRKFGGLLEPPRRDGCGAGFCHPLLLLHTQRCCGRARQPSMLSASNSPHAYWAAALPRGPQIRLKARLSRLASLSLSLPVSGQSWHNCVFYLSFCFVLENKRDHICISQRAIADGPQPTRGSVGYAILLEQQGLWVCLLSQSALTLQYQGGVVRADGVWPAKLKRFTRRPFMEKPCQRMA